MYNMGAPISACRYSPDSAIFNHSIGEMNFYFSS